MNITPANNYIEPVRMSDKLIQKSPQDSVKQKILLSTSENSEELKTADKNLYSNAIKKDVVKEYVQSTVRTKDEFLFDLRNKLSMAKNALESVIKNYPPFPMGSDERIKYLKSFSAVKKQIDALTVPTPPKESEASDNYTFEIVDGKVKILSKSDVTKNINIPDLAESSSNSEIIDTFKKLNMALEYVDSVDEKASNVLKQTVNRMFESIGLPSKQQEVPLSYSKVSPNSNYVDALI